MGRAIAIDLDKEPRSAGMAREELEPFRESLDEASFIDLRLVVSELVAEAIGQARGPRPGSIALRAGVRGDRVWAEVTEGADSYHLVPGQPGPGERGWGVSLTQRLSERWGVRREGRATSAVWFEMPLTRRDGTA